MKDVAGPEDRTRNLNTIWMAHPLTLQAQQQTNLLVDKCMQWRVQQNAIWAL